MAELALGAQGIFQSLMGALNALPLWAVAALVFLPTLLSLFTRNPVTILSAALLNLACLALLASGSAFAAPVALAAFAASLILVLFGLRERLLWKNLSALEARVGRIDGQMMAFLEALEKRSDIMDERTEEARNAFREARQAYEEIRRAAQARAEDDQEEHRQQHGDGDERQAGVGEQTIERRRGIGHEEHGGEQHPPQPAHQQAQAPGPDLHP